MVVQNGLPKMQNHPISPPKAIKPAPNPYGFAQGGNQSSSCGVQLGMKQTEQKVWTYKELLELGKTRGEIAGALKKGKIHRLFHGVYTTAAHPDARIVWEGLLKVRPNAVLDGKSAIEAHQGKEPSLPLQARVPTGNLRKGAAALLRLRRSLRLQWKQKFGFKVVTLADAVATYLRDGGSTRDLELRKVVETAYYSERGNQRQARELKALRTAPKSQLRKFFDNCISGNDSKLEKHFILAVREVGFQTQQNYKLGGYKWDLVIKSLKVVIDVDSRMYHRTESRSFVIDRWKTNDAQAEGWVALRITDDCVDYALPQIIEWLQELREYRRIYPRRSLSKQSIGPVWNWHNAMQGTF